MKRKDLLTAAGLVVAALAVLLSTMDIGFGRDEGYYFKAGELYSHWFGELGSDWSEGRVLEPFGQRDIDKHWSYNPEHPVIYKTLFGLSWRLFGAQAPPPGVPAHTLKKWYRGKPPPKPMLGLMRESTAFRLPTAVTAALLVGLLYLFGAAAWNRKVGLAAALLFMTLPRAFYHAHLAAFDMPVTAWVTATLIAFWWADQRPACWRRATLVGVVFGISLGVKLNAFFTPFIAALWWLWHHRAELRTPGWRARWPRSVVTVAVVSPLLFFALWPRLWFDTVERLSWYLQRHLNHEYYWAYYFGRLLVEPPFPLAFPFAMSAVTVPVTTLLLLFAGLYLISRRGGLPGHHGAGSLAVIAMVFPFCVIAGPYTPVFGGTKHWLAAMPWLALLAAVGVGAVGAAVAASPWIAGRPWARGVPWAVAGLMALPPAYATAHAHPNTVAYYNEWAGGMAGAGHLSMQREFWGSTGGHVLDWVNDSLPKKARVHWHDTNRDSYLLYKREGRLREDVRFIWQRQAADWSLFHWHKEFLDDSYDFVDEFDAVPHHVYAPDGVPLLIAWGRRGAVDRASPPVAP